MKNNTLQFKQEWFEILNTCDRQLRITVTEAVLRYYYADEDPRFDDEAHRIAFEFIRKDIDATRARRIAAMNRRKNKPAPSEVRASEETVPPEPVAPVDACPDTPQTATPEEENLLGDLLHFWNDTMEKRSNPCISRIMPGTPRYANALGALRSHGFETACKVIGVTARNRFLNGDDGAGFLASFDWLFHPCNFGPMADVAASA